jgi:hypothetical protein
MEDAFPSISPERRVRSLLQLFPSFSGEVFPSARKDISKKIYFLVALRGGRRSFMTVDERGAKLIELMTAALEQKGITQTPRELVETTLNNIKMIDGVLAEYQKSKGEDFVNRQIQLAYGKGALEYLLIFL